MQGAEQAAADGQQATLTLKVACLLRHAQQHMHAELLAHEAMAKWIHIS